MMEDLKYLLEQSATVEPTSFEEVVDGTYYAKIDTVEFTTTKAGDNCFKWEFSILDGKYKGQHVWDYTMLKTPEGMARLTTILKKFGIDVTSMETIMDGLGDIIDVPINLVVKTTTSSQGKVFVNKSISPKI
jgi:hypothetical protein